VTRRVRSEANTVGASSTRSLAERTSGKGPLKLDALDQAIINHLQEDGTLTYREIAKRCKSSEPTIRRRVFRLQRNDVMRIVAVVDPFKRGYPVVAIINMQIDQRQMRSVKTILAGMKELRFVGVTVGAFDVVAEAWFQSSEEMLRFTSDTLSQVTGVIRVEPLQIHEMVTYAYDWGKFRRPSPESDTVQQPSRLETRRANARNGPLVAKQRRDNRSRVVLQHEER
jgi:Lrp/AsnC family transcriptional regulator for asnA, asnC and gidA